MRMTLDVHDTYQSINSIPNRTAESFAKNRIKSNIYTVDNLSVPPEAEPCACRCTFGQEGACSYTRLAPARAWSLQCRTLNFNHALRIQMIKPLGVV